MISTSKNKIIRGSESGAVLIVVLLVLILITLLGTIAIQRGSTDLRLATASQVGKLTFQSTDAAFNKLEKEDRSLGQGNSVDNVRGYVTRPGKQYIGREIVFCLRPRTSKFFDQTKLTEKTSDGTGYISGKNDGFCDVGDSADYVGESRTVTQMTFAKSSVKDALPYSLEGDSTYTDDQVSQTGRTPFECANFEVYATSLIPAFSNESTAKINSCLKVINTDALKEKCDAKVKAQHADYATRPELFVNCSIDACLESLGVPYNTQMQAYKSKPIGVRCLS
ncbi:PilX N-terminal domain-containing pilus assembly protein [Psychrobacter celer]|uniref:PilX N-terminal domain-containing pilus assembly protein n=1 Tax=Psychrobacter celer TaxID=306572 RepID=UPI002FE445D5